uniref:Uncharacterized protein LOC100378899 n=1 Tax=Saccoglossus kowalevskii TaxID=10224 RepID=A0ABM0LY74_SACKO
EDYPDTDEEEDVVGCNHGNGEMMVDKGEDYCGFSQPSQALKFFQELNNEFHSKVQNLSHVSINPTTTKYMDKRSLSSSSADMALNDKDINNCFLKCRIFETLHEQMNLTDNAEAALQSVDEFKIVKPIKKETIKKRRSRYWLKDEGLEPIYPFPYFPYQRFTNNLWNCEKKNGKDEENVLQKASQLWPRIKDLKLENECESFDSVESCEQFIVDRSIKREPMSHNDKHDLVTEPVYNDDGLELVTDHAGHVEKLEVGIDPIGHDNGLDAVTDPTLHDDGLEIVTDLVGHDDGLEVVTDPMVHDDGHKLVTHSVGHDDGLELVTHSVGHDDGLELVTDPVGHDDEHELVTDPVVHDDGLEVVTDPMVHDDGLEVVTDPVSHDDEHEVVTDPVGHDVGLELVTHSVGHDDGHELVTDLVGHDDGHELVTGPVGHDDGHELVTHSVGHDDGLELVTGPVGHFDGHELVTDLVGHDDGHELVTDPVGHDDGLELMTDLVGHDDGHELVTDLVGHDDGHELVTDPVGHDDGLELVTDPVASDAKPAKIMLRSVVRSSKLLLWCQKAVENYPGIQVDNITSSWKNGLLLCAIIQRFRPDLINYECLKAEEVAENNQLAFDIAEREFGITPVMTGKEMASLSQPDKLTMVAYLSQFYEIFKDELPLETVKQVDLPEEEFIPGRKAQRLSLLTRLNKKLSQKKSPRREKDYGNREEKENQRKSPAGGSRRREIARRYHEDLLNAENEAKLWDKREDLNVGVRGANKVSAMANSLFAQFQEIAGVKQTPSKAVNRPSFVVGSSHSSPINTMAEQLYEQFEVLAGQKHQSQLEGKRSMTSKNKQIQDMAEQLRAHFQKADSSQMEPRYGDQVQEMVTLLQDQFNRLAGCESADIEPIDKPQISVSTHYHIKDMAVKLENNFKDITSMSPKPVAGEQRPQVSPQQQGKIKELAEELHNKFAAMTAVQHPELVLDRRRSLSHIKAMSDTLLTQFKEKQRQQHTCSEPTGHINRMAEHLLEQCQQIAIEKEAAQQVTPSKKSVSVKAQQLQAKFKELSGEKPTIKEPPKRATHGAKKPVDTGALSHRQVHDMAGQILNKFEQISNPSIEKSKSASSASSTEVQFMTYQLLAKVEEMAKQTAEPKKITQISEGQLQETTDRFLSDMQERQKQPEKTNVTTGVGSIYDILMARFQPVEEDNTSKDDNQDEPLTELNIADRMLFSKFRDIAGLKSTRAEDQQKEPKQRTSWWGSQQPKSKQFTGSSAGGSDICFFCCKRVYVMERLSAEGLFFHRGCFKCSYCNTTLRIGNYAFYMPPNENKLEGRFYCRPHFKYSKAADGGPRKRRMMELGAKENLPDSPPVLVTTTPDKQSWLAELDGPLEKKSRGTPDHLNRSWESLSNCTPERIFLDSTLDGTLQRSQMSEEEISNYNYGDAASVHEMTEYDESSSSDDSDVEFDIEPVAIPAEHSDHWQKSPQWDLSDDDDYSWDESDNDYEEDDYDYESDDDLSDGEMVPVEVDSRNLAWTEPESPKENVMAENEVNNIESDAEGEKTPEAADSSNEELQPLSESLTKQEFPEIQQTEPQPEPQNKDSPEELFDHQGFVASMTSLKLQWLSNPEPPDHSMWGRRRLPSKTPKTVSLEEEKPPPIPPLPSQEDLVKAHIIKAEDMTAEKVKPDIDDEDTSVETVEEVVLVDKVTEEEEIIKEQLPKGDLRKERF